MHPVARLGHNPHLHAIGRGRGETRAIGLVVDGGAAAVDHEDRGARVFEHAPVPLHPMDPVPYAAVAVLLAFVAFATMLVPAKRASGVPPSEALRTE